MGYSAPAGPKRLSGAALNSMINMDQPFIFRCAWRIVRFYADYITHLQTRVEARLTAAR